MFLSVLFLLTSSEQHPYSVEITKDNVFDIIGKKEHVYVHFFAEGCRHCAKMAPEWNELVRIYHPVQNVIMATINCDRWSSLCFSFDGTSTPSVQHFGPRERKGVQYGGERTIIPMTKWVISTSEEKPYTKPNSLLYARSIDEIKNIIKDGQVLLVVDDQKTHFYNQTEIRQCEGQSEAKVIAISKDTYPNESAAYCGSNDTNNCIVLLNKDEVFKYDGPIEYTKILDFVDEHPLKDESL